VHPEVSSTLVPSALPITVTRRQVREIAEFEGWDTAGVTTGPGRGGLLDDATLEMSAVVANCAMNRERQLAGVNSYARELGFHPLLAVSAQVGDGGGTAAWLDLCCGSGRALIQAALQLDRAGRAGRVALTGVDLVDAFDAAPGSVPGLELVCAPVAAWAPRRSFDLITCVHGLHYIGDKLALLTRAAGWLTPGGRLVADLDLSAVKVGGPAATRRLRSRLRAAGFAYSPRRHQIARTGRRDIRMPYAYLGADDRAGPGYTGQPAVTSYYAEEP
jgi:SAM-dependent methyltransferase